MSLPWCAQAPADPSAIVNAASMQTTFLIRISCWLDLRWRSATTEGTGGSPPATIVPSCNDAWGNGCARSEQRQLDPGANGQGHQEHNGSNERAGEALHGKDSGIQGTDGWIYRRPCPVRTIVTRTGGFGLQTGGNGRPSPRFSWARCRSPGRENRHWAEPPGHRKTGCYRHHIGVTSPPQLREAGACECRVWAIR